MCSAWKLMSASLQSPGTTTHGPTPPNSAVTGLSRLGVLLALRALLSGHQFAHDGVHEPRPATRDELAGDLINWADHVQRRDGSATSNSTSIGPFSYGPGKWMIGSRACPDDGPARCMQFAGGITANQNGGSSYGRNASNERNERIRR
jgi:hypothetical protein